MRKFMVLFAFVVSASNTKIALGFNMLPNQYSVASNRLISGSGMTGEIQPMKAFHSSRRINNYKATMKPLAASASIADIPGDDAASSATTNQPPFPIVLWRFTRPHTLIGSFLAIPALHALAAPSYKAVFTMPVLASILFAMFPSLLMNLYITGLNQITDVEIDKINKPDLPIAAGILSKRSAIMTVIISLIVSLAIGASHPVLGTPGLNLALWGSGILGTMYSLEPFRLKRFPLLAAFCTVTVRGAIINAAFFAHARVAAFNDLSAISVLNCLLTDPKCFWSSLFFAVFGLVIALMKDVPDVAGDAIANVKTFSVRVGQKRIFKAMRRLLTGLFLAYGIGFLNGSMKAKSTIVTASRAIIGTLSVLCGLSVRKESETVDPEDSKQVYNYYMHLWKLFYICYLALPFVK